MKNNQNQVKFQFFCSAQGVPLISFESYDLGGLVPRTSAKSSFFKVLKMKFLVDPGEEDEPLLSCSLFHIVSIDPILPLIFI